MDSVSQEKKRIANIELEHLCFSKEPGALSTNYSKRVNNSRVGQNSTNKHKIKSIN